MRFDELNKFDLGYNGFTDFEKGQQSKQAEINDALKQRDSFIKAHNIAMNDVCNLKAELEREKQRTTDNYDACDDIVKMSDDIVKGLEAENYELHKKIDSLKSQLIKAGCD